MNTSAVCKEGPAMEHYRHLSLAKGKKKNREELMSEYEAKRLELENLAQSEFDRKGHLVSGELLDKSKVLDEIGNQIMDACIPE